MRAHPTVVRLDHLADAGADWITASYHKTAALNDHLGALNAALDRPAGCGIFLIGPYGSGKSHFLAYVVQNLRAGRLASGAPRVVAVSLLNFRGGAPLEDVVGAALEVAGPEGGDRRVGYEALDERHSGGVVLVLDELSEFLRSKPDHRRFTEDVRFLQFLGEWAQGRRFWVIAAMQEQIEHTGDLEHGMYRKIKDRYPIRFLLTTSHVKELVRDAILEREAGCVEIAAQVAEDVRRALPAAGVGAGEIEALFPVHPATIELLEEVRDRFSQTRGVVDFVVTRLAGDAARGVPAFLDRPIGELLTPEHIVDHFADLFELQSEFQPLAQKVLPWYRKNLSTLFEKPARAELAGRLLKLLVLARLSSAREGIRAEEGAAWLLVRASRIEPERNVEVVRRTLDALAERGRHVVRDGDVYRLDLAQDDVDEFERALRREVAACEAHEERVFDHLLPRLAGSAFDPTVLPTGEFQHRSLRWRCHERRYASWFGSGAPPTAPTAGVPVLVVRPVYGQEASCPEAFTFRPRPLRAERGHFELLALVKLGEREWSEETTHRLAQRVRDGVARLASEVGAAFAHGELIDPSGEVVPVERGLPDGGFEAFLARVAERIFQRVFPGFEKFAPLSGPLPGETARRFAEFVSVSDLDAESDDDAVNLVREAYLVPMGLLSHRGTGFAIPAQLERRELARLLLPLLEHRPVPAAVYEHLAQPVYGLVPDQVRVLLLAFLSLGEIDLVKGGKSFRELHPLLSDPRQYDAIEPAEGLGPDALQKLERCARGLRVQVPARWNVAAQRRVIGALAARARELASKVEPRLFPITGVDGVAGALIERARETLSHWKQLGEGDEIEAFERFVEGVGSVDAFLARAGEAAQLPERLERLVREVERFRHLFQAIPSTARETCREQDPGEPPPADELAPLEAWLGRARSAYQAYVAAYRSAHDEFWSARKDAPGFGWTPPAVARSRHLSLGDELDRLDAVRRRAAAADCRALTSLDYQPVCRCGFDGEVAPIDALSREFAASREAIEKGLGHFFSHDVVRDRVRALVEDGIESNERTRRYLAGDEPWPESSEVDRFDAHLSGVEVVRRLSGRDLLSAIGGRPIAREAVSRAVLAYLAGEGVEASHVLIEADHGVLLTEEIAGWCLALALRHGATLPKGLDSETLDAAAAALDPRHVGAAAVTRLDALALPEPVMRRVVTWLSDGRVPLPPAGADEPGLLTAIRELRTPTKPTRPEELASLAATLYAETPRLLAVDRDGWLARLDALAQSTLDPPLAPLVDELKTRSEVPWLILDAFAAPMWSELRGTLGGFLGGRAIEEVAFAMAPPRTTTDAFYRSLIESGAVKSCVKVDVVDDLIHDRAVPFADLVELARAELRLALRGVQSRLDPALPLLVFADHGFRLDPAGRQWVHGGASTLERLVPVVRFGRA